MCINTNKCLSASEWVDVVERNKEAFFSFHAVQLIISACEEKSRKKKK